MAASRKTALQSYIDRHHDDGKAREMVTLIEDLREFLMFDASEKVMGFNERGQEKPVTRLYALVVMTNELSGMYTTNVDLARRELMRMYSQTMQIDGSYNFNSPTFVMALYRMIQIARMVVYGYQDKDPDLRHPFGPQDASGQFAKLRTLELVIDPDMDR